MNSRPGSACAAAAARGTGRAARGGATLGRGTLLAGAGGRGAAVSTRAAGVPATTRESTGPATYPSPEPSVGSLFDPELKSHGAATAPSTTSVTTAAGIQRHLDGGGAY